MAMNLRQQIAGARRVFQIRVAGQQPLFPVLQLVAQEFHGEVIAGRGTVPQRRHGIGPEPGDVADEFPLVAVAVHIGEPFRLDLQFGQRALDDKPFGAVLHEIDLG